MPQVKLSWFELNSKFHVSNQKIWLESARTHIRTNELTCLAVICFLVGCTMNLNRSQAMAPMQKDDMKMGKFWAAFKNLHRNSEKKGRVSGRIWVNSSGRGWRGSIFAFGRFGFAQRRMRIETRSYNIIQAFFLDYLKVIRHSCSYYA